MFREIVYPQSFHFGLELLPELQFAVLSGKYDLRLVTVVRKVFEKLSGHYSVHPSRILLQRRKTFHFFNHDYVNFYVQSGYELVEAFPDRVVVLVGMERVQRVCG